MAAAATAATLRTHRCGVLLICAGGQAQGRVLADLHVLQLATLTWLPQTAPQPPLPRRCRHSLAVTVADASAAAEDSAANSGRHGHAAADAAEVAGQDPHHPPAAAAGAEPCQEPEAAGSAAPGQADGAAAAASTSELLQPRRMAWLYGGFDGSDTCGGMFQIALPDSLVSVPQRAPAADAAEVRHYTPNATCRTGTLTAS